MADAFGWNRKRGMVRPSNSRFRTQSDEQVRNVASAMLGVGDQVWSQRDFRRRAIHRANTCDIQHFRRFLPNGQQNLHLITCGTSGFYLGFAYIRHWSSICTALDPEEV